MRKALLKLVRPTSKVHLGSRRRWGTTGTLARPWNVIINVPEEVLANESGTFRVQVSLRDALAKQERNGLGGELHRAHDGQPLEQPSGVLPLGEA